MVGRFGQVFLLLKPSHNVARELHYGVHQCIRHCAPSLSSRNWHQCQVMAPVNGNLPEGDYLPESTSSTML